MKGLCEIKRSLTTYPFRMGRISMCLKLPSKHPLFFKNKLVTYNKIIFGKAEYTVPLLSSGKSSPKSNYFHQLIS